MLSLLLMVSQLVSFNPQPDIKLEIIGTQSKDKNWVFFAPHEDENISNNLVKEKISQYGGLFVILQQNGQREITLTLNETNLQIDPNRIFTEEGRRSSLHKLNPNVLPNSDVFRQGIHRAEQLSAFIINAMGGINKKNTWIAMHNNTNGYTNDGHNGLGTISINRYKKKLDSGSKFLIDVHVSKHDEDDLFFVTDKTDFNLMKQSKWSAILQNPAVAHIKDEDDGSLSVFAEMKGIRYINIEAERELNGFGQDHRQIQQQMVNFTFEKLLNQNKSLD